MPSIKCGNCQGTHSSVREVRECHGTPEKGEIAKDIAQQNGHETPTISDWNETAQVYDEDLGYRTARPRAMRDFVPDHLKEADTLAKAYPKKNFGAMPEGDRFYLNVPFDDKDEAKKYGARWEPKRKLWYVSNLEREMYADELRQWIPGEITTRKVADKPKPQQGWTEEQIPAGRYAILQDDTWKFYLVSWGKEGTRWEGRVFLDVQAGPDHYPIRNAGTKKEILTAIADNPKEASAQYGHKIGRCGLCHTPLTRADSIERGIGPKCAEKRGWL